MKKTLASLAILVCFASIVVGIPPFNDTPAGVKASYIGHGLPTAKGSWGWRPADAEQSLPAFPSQHFMTASMSGGSISVWILLASALLFFAGLTFSLLTGRKKNMDNAPPILRTEPGVNTVSQWGFGQWQCDTQFRVTFFDGRIRRWFPELDEQEKPKCHQIFHGHETDKNCHNCPVHEALQGKSTVEAESEIMIHGQKRLFRTICSPLFRDGRIVGASCFMDDLSHRKMAGELEGLQRHHLAQLFECAPQAVAFVEKSGTLLGVNKRFEELFGYERNTITGRDPRSEFIPPDLQVEWENTLKRVCGGNANQRETVRLHKDGRSIPVSMIGSPVMVDSQPQGAFFIFQEITQRSIFEDQLRLQAFHDGITGLPNKTLFTERLERAAERGKQRAGYFFAVMLLNLDGFKQINDRWGREAGDDLLREVAARFGKCLKEMDTLARLGKDEFALLIEELDTPRQAVHMAKQLQDALERPFKIKGDQAAISAGMGIVLNTGGYDRPGDILRDADIALCRAKESGPGAYRIFSDVMREEATEAMRREAELRNALANREMTLHYQPIYTLLGPRLVGFEALLRWNHPTEGLLEPAKFLSLAEETGVILSLGQWILEEACSQLRQWLGLVPRHTDMYMSVNISLEQLIRSDLVESVVQALTKSGLPSARLKLEFAEADIVNDIDGVLEAMNRLKELGVSLMVDNFGTGGASLSRLQLLPMDYLKVDRSFVSGENKGTARAWDVHTMVAMARSLGWIVVAEGVETADQLNGLKGVSCHQAQGLYFSEPVDRNGALALLRQEFAGAATGPSERVSL